MVRPLGSNREKNVIQHVLPFVRQRWAHLRDFILLGKYHCQETSQATGASSDPSPEGGNEIPVAMPTYRSYCVDGRSICSTVSTCKAASYL